MVPPNKDIGIVDIKRVAVFTVRQSCPPTATDILKMRHLLKVPNTRMISAGVIKFLPRGNAPMKALPYHDVNAPHLFEV